MRDRFGGGLVVEWSRARSAAGPTWGHLLIADDPAARRVQRVGRRLTRVRPSPPTPQSGRLPSGRAAKPAAGGLHRRWTRAC